MRQRDALILPASGSIRKPAPLPAPDASGLDAGWATESSRSLPVFGERLLFVWGEPGGIAASLQNFSAMPMHAFAPASSVMGLLLTKAGRPNDSADRRREKLLDWL